MYKIIVTDDFINLLKDLPIRYLSLITKSFIYIGLEEDDSIQCNNNFIDDLLEQIRNQELE